MRRSPSRRRFRWPCRAFTRPGHDWTDRVPAIAAALRSLPVTFRSGRRPLTARQSCAIRPVSPTSTPARSVGQQGLPRGVPLRLRPARGRRPRPSSKPQGGPPRAPRAGAERGRPGDQAVRAPGRDGPAMFGTPAPWVSRASCRSGGIGPTARVDRRTGSRRRIRTCPPQAVAKKARN